MRDYRQLLRILRVVEKRQDQVLLDWVAYEIGRVADRNLRIAIGQTHDGRGSDR